MKQKKSLLQGADTLQAEILGWYGMGAILLAYGLASFQIIEAQDLTYQLLNITGAMGLLIIAYAKNVLQSVILNIVWILVGLVALTTILVD